METTWIDNIPLGVRGVQWLVLGVVLTRLDYDVLPKWGLTYGKIQRCRVRKLQ